MKLCLNNKTEDQIKIYLSSSSDYFMLYPNQNLSISLDHPIKEINLIPNKNSDYSMFKLTKFAVATRYTISSSSDYIQLNIIKQQKENDNYILYFRYIILEYDVVNYNCSYVCDKEDLFKKGRRQDAFYIFINFVFSLCSSTGLTAIISIFLSTGMERVVKFLIFLLLFILVFVIEMILEFFFTKKSRIKRITNDKYIEFVFAQNH